MTDTKNLMDVPIEYKVLAYKSSWDKSDKVIYARKISDFAVAVTGMNNGSIDTSVFFEPDKYDDQKPKENVWSYIRSDELLEKLGIRRTHSLDNNAGVEQILTPVNNAAKWYHTAVDITSMFKNKVDD